MHPLLGLNRWEMLFKLLIPSGYNFLKSFVNQRARQHMNIYASKQICEMIFVIRILTGHTFHLLLTVWNILKPNYPAISVTSINVF